GPLRASAAVSRSAAVAPRFSDLLLSEPVDSSPSSWAEAMPAPARVVPVASASAEAQATNRLREDILTPCEWGWRRDSASTYGRRLRRRSVHSDGSPTQIGALTPPAGCVSTHFHRVQQHGAPATQWPHPPAALPTPVKAIPCGRHHTKGNLRDRFLLRPLGGHPRRRTQR